MGIAQFKAATLLTQGFAKIKQLQPAPLRIQRGRQFKPHLGHGVGSGTNDGGCV